MDEKDAGRPALADAWDSAVTPLPMLGCLGRLGLGGAAGLRTFTASCTTLLLHVLPDDARAAGRDAVLALRRRALGQGSDADVDAQHTRVAPLAAAFAGEGGLLLAQAWAGRGLAQATTTAPTTGQHVPAIATCEAALGALGKAAGAVAGAACRDSASQAVYEAGDGLSDADARTLSHAVGRMAYDAAFHAADQAVRQTLGLALAELLRHLVQPAWPVPRS